MGGKGIESTELEELLRALQTIEEISIPEKEDSEEEPDIILARIDRDENGEAVYLPPTDEEYDAVADIYDAM